jgi:hypothetical protein
MANFHTDLFKLLEPLPDTEGCWGWFDDTRTCMYFPCEPRPKGSATPLPKTTKEGKPYIQWIAGSNSSGAAKLHEQERIMRQGVAAMWKLGFTPYDEAVTLDAVMVIKKKKTANPTEYHTQYPDRDKLLRAVQDCISPMTVAKKRQIDKPHLVVDDALIDDGRTTKMWLHKFNQVTHNDDDTEGIYVTLYPTCFDPF